MCLASLLLPAAARAQERTGRPDRFEVTISLSIDRPLQDGTYETSYSPPFTPGAFSSSAGQALTLLAGRSTGLAAAFAYLPNGRIGVEALFNYFESSLAGANAPYEVFLRYTALLPPDYVPREFVYERSLQQRDTEGYLRNLSFSANTVVRVGDGPVSVQFSGGLSIFQIRGSAESLGYTKLWLGGHSVLFLEHYRMAFAVQPATALGLNLGAELDIALSDRLTLAIDGRYFYAPTSEAEVELTGIVNLDEVISVDPIPQIQQQMDLRPVEIDPSFLRLAFGLKVRW